MTNNTASGDLRNVVKTLTDLPTGFTRRVCTTINDREFQVVARNACLLLFALSMERGEDVGTQDVGTLNQQSRAEALVHLWYSALLPAATVTCFRTQILPMIEAVNEQIFSGVDNVLYEKTWEFSSGATVTLVLKKDEWTAVRDLLNVSLGLTRKDACQIRQDICLAPEREDYRHRWYFKDETPFMRVAKQRFREDGLLPPFGSSRTEFSEPNP